MTRRPISTVIILLAIVAATLFLTLLDDPSERPPLHAPDPSACTRGDVALDVHMRGGEDARHA